MSVKSFSGKRPPFVHDGQADLELTLQARTEAVLYRLATLGFGVKGQSGDVHKVLGRMPVEKVELLLKEKAVLFIAPRRRQSVS